MMFVCKRKKSLLKGQLLPICFLLAFSPALLHAEDPMVLKIGTLHIGDGTVLENAYIVIKDGKIDFVGKSFRGVQDRKIYAFVDGVATPGFIAANAYLKISSQTKSIAIRSGQMRVTRNVPTLNEERSESTPEMNLLDSIDPRSEDFEKAWRGGITCVYLAPGNQNVFNGTGTVVKTKADSLEEMLVRNHVHLKATLGTEPAHGSLRPFREPSSLKTRRPQNRMGVIFTFRNELTDVLNNASVPDSELSPQEFVFRSVLKKELPLRIRARSYMDIKAALRMMEEFGFRWILEDGVDAHKYLDDLKKHNIPVIYGPVYKTRGRPDFNSEEDSFLPETPVLLAQKGIEFAFQNNEMSAIDSLRDEAIYAVSLGLSRESALKALTLHAARILGVEDRIGTIAKGKDADLLIFNGDPFDPSSCLESIIINGLLLDPNK